MACYYPRPGFEERDPDTGKRSYSFLSKGSQLENEVMIPCGKCEGCRARKAMDWSTRLYHESITSPMASFLTLTYAEAPEKISVKHCQDFLKRFRFNRHMPSIRYFMVGEYGEKTRRPHYHAIIFGTDFRGDAYTVNDQLWANPHLDKIWSHGTVTIGDVTPASVSYVAGYCQKKIDDQDTFNIMSRCPPLGYDYAVRYQDDMQRMGKCIVGGQERPIPEAYFNWTVPSKHRPSPVWLDQVKGNAMEHVVEKDLAALRNQEINKRANRVRKEGKI